MMIIWGLLTIICCWTGVSSYSSGPPPTACASMTPSHDNDVAMTSASGYTITLSNNAYSPNDIITVNMSSTTGIPFKGVFLQARLATNTNPQGMFMIDSGETELKYVACGNTNGSVSHNSAVDKTIKLVKWRAPSTNVGNITFRATFVKVKAEFWTNVASGVLVWNTNSTTQMNSTTPSDRMTGSTTPSSVAHTSVKCVVVLFAALLSLLSYL